jgi:hypothetical protein
MAKVPKDIYWENKNDHSEFGHIPLPHGFLASAQNLSKVVRKSVTGKYRGVLKIEAQVQGAVQVEIFPNDQLSASQQILHEVDIPFTPNATMLFVLVSFARKYFILVGLTCSKAGNLDGPFGTYELQPIQKLDGQQIESAVWRSSGRSDRIHDRLVLEEGSESLRHRVNYKIEDEPH